MRVAIAILALLAISQLAAADDGYNAYKASSYTYKKGYNYKSGYVKPKTETVLVTKTVTDPPTVVAVKGSPIIEVKYDQCRPVTLALTAEIVYKCPDGCTAVTTAGKITSCTKVVCKAQPPKLVQVEVEVPCDPKPVYTKPVYKDSYKPVYKNDYKPHYGDDHKYNYYYAKHDGEKYYQHVKYDPKVVVVPKKCTKTQTVEVKQPDVCETVKVDPIAYCSGTISNGVCIIGYETAPCPEKYVAGNGLCTKNITIVKDGPTQYVTVPGKTRTVVEAVPVYKKGYSHGYGYSKSGKYNFLSKFFGKKYEHPKYEPKYAPKYTPKYNPDYIPACPYPANAVPITKPGGTTTVVVVIDPSKPRPPIVFPPMNNGTSNSTMG